MAESCCTGIRSIYVIVDCEFSDCSLLRRNNPEIPIRITTVWALPAEKKFGLRVCITTLRRFIKSPSSSVYVVRAQSLDTIMVEGRDVKTGER